LVAGNCVPAGSRFTELQHPVNAFGNLVNMMGDKQNMGLATVGNEID
jgi:hypothetical protein